MAAKLYARVPNLGNIEIDAENFATEDTLRALTKAMGGTVSSAAGALRSSAAAADQAADSIGRFGDELDLTSDEVEKSGRKFRENFDRVGYRLKSTMDSVGHGLTSLATYSDDGGNAIKTVVGAVGDVASQTADTLGALSMLLPRTWGRIVGVALSSIAGASAKLAVTTTGIVTDTLRSLREQQRALFDSGVYFARGIDDAAQAAAEAGTTIGVLARTAADSSHSLRLFSGGAANGMKMVLGSFRDLDESQRGLLYAMGYSQEEILSAMADFGASAAMAGKNLTVDELRKGSLEYLVNLQELSRLTGVDAKQRRAAADALNRETAFRAYLDTLQPKQAEALRQSVAALGAMNPAMAEAAKAMLMGVQPLDPAMAVIVARLRGAGINLEQLSDRAREGSISQEEINKAIGDFGTVGEQSARALRDNLGGYQSLYYLQQSSGTVGEVTKTLGGMIVDLRTIANAAKDGAEKFDVAKVAEEMRKSASDINESSSSLNLAIGQYTRLENELMSQLQQASLEFARYSLIIMKGLAASIKESFGKAFNIPDLPALEPGTYRYGRNLQELDTTDPLRSLGDEQLREMGLRRETGALTGMGPNDSITYSYRNIENGQMMTPRAPTRPTILPPSLELPVAPVPPSGQQGQLNMSGSNQMSSNDAQNSELNEKIGRLVALNSAMLTALNTNNALTKQAIMAV